MADPGFPTGGTLTPQHGRFLAKMCAKTKELGPTGGVCLAHPLDPPMLMRPVTCILYVNEAAPLLAAAAKGSVTETVERTRNGVSKVKASK